jgi:hypothetical protein
MSSARCYPSPRRSLAVAIRDFSHSKCARMRFSIIYKRRKSTMIISARFFFYRYQPRFADRRRGARVYVIIIIGRDKGAEGRCSENRRERGRCIHRTCDRSRMIAIITDTVRVICSPHSGDFASGVESHN